MTVRMTIALTVQQKAEIDELARQEAVAPESVASRIVQLALEERSSLASDVEHARSEYRSGLFVDHQTVVAESEARYGATTGSAPE
jgi:hypothetical protein